MTWTSKFYWLIATNLNYIWSRLPTKTETKSIAPGHRFCNHLYCYTPRQQSGQEFVYQTYNLINRLRRKGNHIKILWIPTSEDNTLLGLAKEQARAATHEDAIPQEQVSRMKSTTLNLARSQAATTKALPEDVGRHIKRVDAALPGKHTRQLYDGLSWNEATVLAQLRTGMARLNGYLYQINVAQTDQCACGQARETVEHFLFRCRKWTTQRIALLQCTRTHRGNLSVCLGGKSPSDDQQWTPNLEAVRASIRFAIARADSTPSNHVLVPTQ